MEVLYEQQKMDPQYKNKRDSMEKAIQNYIQSSGKYENYQQLALPKIPGFTPTGNVHIDLVNFAIAKQQLFERDPEAYLKLTRRNND